MPADLAQTVDNAVKEALDAGTDLTQSSNRTALINEIRENNPELKANSVASKVSTVIKREVKKRGLNVQDYGRPSQGKKLAENLKSEPAQMIEKSDEGKGLDEKLKDKSAQPPATKSAPLMPAYEISPSTKKAIGHMADALIHVAAPKADPMSDDEIETMGDLGADAIAPIIVKHPNTVPILSGTTFITIMARRIKQGRDKDPKKEKKEKAKNDKEPEPQPNMPTAPTAPPAPPPEQKQPAAPSPFSGAGETKAYHKEAA